MNKKQLQVSAIKNGTVIDHIPAHSLFMVISILGLDKLKKPITFGTNLYSSKLKCKGIIKLTDVFFQDEDINKIALVAPQAKLNIIKDYKVVEKKNLSLPMQAEGFIRCGNPNCITNNESVSTRFRVLKNKADDKVAVRCEYCEKVTGQDHFRFL
jgi:aspartate carbamoyltransferase regulatory subunit